MNDKNRTKKILTIINRLLAAFPNSHSGTSDDVIDGYLIGLADIPPHHIANAASRFLRGDVPGYKPAFAPSPPQLAVEARRIYLDAEFIRVEAGSADFKALEKYFDKKIHVGMSGATTCRKSELEQARKALA